MERALSRKLLRHPLDAAAGAAEGGTEKMSGIEFLLVVIGAATLTSWLFKAVDIVEGRR